MSNDSVLNILENGELYDKNHERLLTQSDLKSQTEQIKSISEKIEEMQKTSQKLNDTISSFMSETPSVTLINSGHQYQNEFGTFTNNQFFLNDITFGTGMYQGGSRVWFYPPNSHDSVLTCGNKLNLLVYMTNKYGFCLYHSDRTQGYVTELKAAFKTATDKDVQPRPTIKTTQNNITLDVKS